MPSLLPHGISPVLVTGIKRLGPDAAQRHSLLRVDLVDGAATADAVQAADQDLVPHLAAESHVNRSIDGPGTFIESKVTSTYHLLQAVRTHWDALPAERQQRFRLHHISTDEVFGSLGETGRFSEATPYDPRSPYSASKAASDHLVSDWHRTYSLPLVFTNWSLAATQCQLERSYCVGGHGECSREQVGEAICSLLDQRRPAGTPHARLITPVKDRPGHERRYTIDPTRISTELGWLPRHNLEEGLAAIVDWYLANLEWCDQVQQRAGYGGERIGVRG